MVRFIVRLLLIYLVERIRERYKESMKLFYRFYEPMAAVTRPTRPAATTMVEITHIMVFIIALECHTTVDLLY